MVVNWETGQHLFRKMNSLSCIDGVGSLMGNVRPKVLNGEYSEIREIFMLKTNQDADTPKTDTPKNISRGGRLTKWKGKVASIAPSLLIISTALSVVAAGAAGIASAQTIDTPVTTPNVVATDENVLITPTGSIIVANVAQVIEFTTDFTSTAINRGTISNTVSTGSGNIVTVQNEAGSEDSTARFENHGVMRALTGPAPLPGEASAFLVLKGLHFIMDVIADITNTGEVTVDSTYHGLAVVDAYHFEGNLTGDFTNSGNITATATSSRAIARADGLIAEGRVNNMDVDRNMIGDITNSGTLTATATAELEAETNALRLSGTFNGAFLNTGKVESTATSAGKSATANGIYLDDDMTTDGITNEGVTQATATAQTEASARAYYLSGDLTGNFTNTGTITVKTESRENDASSDAVYVSGPMIGDISNSGTITGMATGGGAARVESIRVNDTFEGAFSNTGKVTAEAESSGDLARAYGIFIDERMITEDGFINAGDVSASATAQTEASARAYYLSGDLTGDFTNTGSITVETKSGQNDASSDGVYVSGPTVGNISNSGTIMGEATGAWDAKVEGIRVNDNFDGVFSNTGTISASAKSTGYLNQVSEVRTITVYFGGDVTSDGITNEGVTEASSKPESGVGAFAFARAYQFLENLTGNFTNTDTGRISVEANSDSASVVADGFYVDQNMDGNFSNSGAITVTGSAERNAVIDGIDVGGTFRGDFSNTGTVSISATSSDADASARGVDIEGEATGSITNAGTVIAQVTAKTNATAQAYRFLRGLTGDFTNSRMITAHAVSREDDASTDGVIVEREMAGDEMVGDISNSGIITATAEGAARVRTQGIHLVETNDENYVGEFAGEFSNTGTVSASATSSDVDAKSSKEESAKARAVRFDGNVTTDGITNAGTVIANASAKTEAYARAFRFGGDLTGDISNSGTITAMADGATKVVADGIYLTGSLDGNLLNAGTVAVRANAVTDATASAIYVGRQAGEKMIRNTGTISASANALNGHVSGIYVEDAQGDIANSGTITVAASGGVDAYGIYVENHDGVISDVGRISARSENGTAYAVYLDEGSGSLNVDTHDTIQGLMHVRAHDVELDARGGTAVFSFEDSAPTEGTFTKKVSDGRSVWFAGGEGGSKPIYTAVAPIDILATSYVVASYGDIIGGTTDFVKPEPRNQAQNEVSRTSTSAAPPFGLNGFGRFANLSAESSEFETTKNVETDLRTYDGNIGVTGVTDGGAAFAIAMGVFRAEGDTPTTEFDTDTLYLNAAYGRSFGTLDFAASLGLGWLRNEKSRQIAGSSDASADYGSTLLTAHLGVGKAFDVGQDVGLNGFGNIRFTRQEDDAYTEKGSSVNASVGKSVSEVLEATAGVEIEKQLPGMAGTLSGGVSGVFRTNLTDPNATVRVLSTTETLTFATSDFSGANLRLGYEKELIPGMLLDFSAEREVGTGAIGPNVRASINWSF